MDTLRSQWNEGRDTLGVWLANPSTITAEMAARVGFDYVCIDNQHGVNDYQQTVAMTQAVLVGGGTPICRVPWNEPGIIGKMLDGGVEGIIVAMAVTPRWARVASVPWLPACAGRITTTGRRTALR
jgi:4-hydroxy-2-oxoheptanedioate aldolase